ncbi:MAG: hypothetical protein ABIQ55_09210 [Gemmatimonadaceae bacterium]
MGYPPFAMPGVAVSRAVPQFEVLPSIRDFLDGLPSIDDFMDAGSSAIPPIDEFLASDAVPEFGDEPADLDAAGWAIARWQSFDWNGAATLSVPSPERLAASHSWDTHEWSGEPLPMGHSRWRRGSSDVPASADEVVRALDGIARRIRSGELLIDRLSGIPPEAAMAAAIAALLRMRD